RNPGVRATGKWPATPGRGGVHRHCGGVGRRQPDAAGAVGPGVSLHGQPEPLRPAAVLLAACMGLERESARYVRRLEPEGDLRELSAGCIKVVARGGGSWSPPAGDKLTDCPCCSRGSWSVLSRHDLGRRQPGFCSDLAFLLLQ